MQIQNFYKVALVGRPNVGKSSLFNRILGKRVAIVDAVPGITRDRIFGKVEKGNQIFELIDTGGFFEGPSTKMEKALLGQLDFALEEADCVLFVMDALSGIHPMDKTILQKLRTLEKHVLYVVNKVDNPRLEFGANEFYKLGLREYFPVSAQHNYGISALLEKIYEKVPETVPSEIKGWKIAVVGKPNVGKSSFINRLLEKERLIVDSVPGTTRDSVAVDFMWKDKPFVLIDTAGLTRRKKFSEAVDSYSMLRTRETIEQADFVILITDADRNIESQDNRIGRMILEAGKGCMIIVNKWDLTQSLRQEHYLKALREVMPFIDFAPVRFLSVLKGFSIDKILGKLVEVLEKKEEKISTATLNTLFEKALNRTLPPFISGKRLKIYYATQISTRPPYFSLYINSIQCAAEHYLRYLENQIRREYPYEGFPIRFRLVPKKKKKN